MKQFNWQTHESIHLLTTFLFHTDVFPNRITVRLLEDILEQFESKFSSIIKSNVYKNIIITIHRKYSITITRKPFIGQAKNYVLTKVKMND